MSQKSVKQRPGVGVGVIVMRDGRFLVLRRKGSHGTGTWSVPGGWMEFGESFESAAVREVQEETGMKIRNVQYVGLTNNIFHDEDMHSITLWMASNWDSEEPTIMEPEKATDMQWVDFESAPQPYYWAFELLLESEFLPEIKRRLMATKTKNA